MIPGNIVQYRLLVTQYTQLASGSWHPFSGLHHPSLYSFRRSQFIDVKHISRAPVKKLLAFPALVIRTLFLNASSFEPMDERPSHVRLSSRVHVSHVSFYF